MDSNTKSELLRDLKEFEEKYKFNELDLNLEIHSDNDKCIYHYTDITALYNILKNESLWLTRYDFMNDSTEVNYLVNLIKDEFDGGICSSMKKELFEEIRSDIYNASTNLFILSLTKNSDSLTLWSNYSNNTGYNLGFHSDRFFYEVRKASFAREGHNDKVKIKDENHYINFCYCYQVIYDINEQKALLRVALEKIIHLYKGYNHVRVLSEDHNYYYLYNYYLLIIKICVYAAYFKNPLFNHEEEYRLAIRVDENLDVTKYRVSNGIIIPYIEVSFSEDGEIKRKLPLSSITVGSKNNIDIAKNGINLFLNNLKYTNINVEKSSIPYRF